MVKISVSTKNTKLPVPREILEGNSFYWWHSTTLYSEYTPHKFSIFRRDIYIKDGWIETPCLLHGVQFSQLSFLSRGKKTH